MSGAGARRVARAAGERIGGKRPGWFLAVTASGVVGISSAVVTYRLLRRVDDSA